MYVCITSVQNIETDTKHLVLSRFRLPCSTKAVVLSCGSTTRETYQRACIITTMHQHSCHIKCKDTTCASLASMSTPSRGGALIAMSKACTTTSMLISCISMVQFFPVAFHPSVSASPACFKAMKTRSATQQNQHDTRENIVSDQTVTPNFCIQQDTSSPLLPCRRSHLFDISSVSNFVVMRPSEWPTHSPNSTISTVSSDSLSHSFNFNVESPFLSYLYVTLPLTRITMKSNATSL